MVDETSALYPDFFDPSDSVSCALSKFEDFPVPTVCELILLFEEPLQVTFDCAVSVCGVLSAAFISYNADLFSSGWTYLELW